MSQEAILSQKLMKMPITIKLYFIHNDRYYTDWPSGYYSIKRSEPAQEKNISLSCLLGWLYIEHFLFVMTS